MHRRHMVLDWMPQSHMIKKQSKWLVGEREWELRVGGGVSRVQLLRDRSESSYQVIASSQVIEVRVGHISQWCIQRQVMKYLRSIVEGGLEFG